MCAAPYSDFEDSYNIVSSTSVSDRGAEGDRTSVHSIIMDNGEKSCKDFRLQDWIHLIVSLLNNFGYLAFVGFLMYKYDSSSDHYVFSALIIIKFMFSSYFLFHGIFREQPFQILMQMLTVLSLWSLDLIYYLSDISNPPDNSDLDKIGLELMLFYLRSVLTVLNLMTGFVIAWKYWTIEQTIFKTVEVEWIKIRVIRILFFGFSLMIFDAEISIVTLLLFVRNGFPGMLLQEILVLTAGSIFLLFWVFLGYKGLRSESKALTWTFLVSSCIQPAYLIVLFIRNIKWSASSKLVLTASSHYMSFVTLTVHLSVVAAIITASHYYGRGYGDALVNGIHITVKNTAEYEELRRILFHPINPRRHSRQRDPSSSRTILLNAEVY